MPASSFPFRRAARETFSFSAPTFSDFTLARSLADALNAPRDLKNFPDQTVKAGDLASAALLDEIFAETIAQYLEEIEPGALDDAASFLDENVGAPEFQTLLQSARELYSTPEARPAAIEFLLRTRLANLNPATQVFREIFDDSGLPSAIYNATFRALDAFFQSLPPFGDEEKSLWQLLLSPILAHPDSLDAQLRFVLKKFGPRIAEKFGTRILVALDLLAEENKPRFFGPGPAQVLDYKSGGGAVGMEEFEAFSPDRDWMPQTVLLAKQTYVWLDQLSKKYGREITRLDQVPDEELDEMASRGMTGLWLIGVWQRSGASQKIKRATGNPDAIASAYSLYSYDIALEIGGPDALENLKSRAAARGIRMASDMVPNHMAIDSKWVVEHPDWFLGLPFPPFPHADFNTPDLCEDPNVGVFLEAGYYSKTDASVVFKRVQYGTDDVRYIYHGNDGTNMPWNDTAQLNYLIPEVREAAIQTILHVARQFPIIRFDAAMTLAKRHFHRLWFPAPGSGGDIPSRAGRGLSPDEFDAAMPKEFWREVVDRIATEAPDTLLLAEAFWLMEGYFVRTLGMHRVYNSAFMNMLRDEKNAEYRLTLKNTLEFDPDILGRFVNFMNNPDEKTASEQFGKQDKYFGVCTLLATLPGLPMFGHGQIEGYGEKYGMEYPRAYWNESPDEALIAHHKTVIFPLLHKRALFAGSENFTLYDFWNEGSVDENVFAYSNSRGEEKALVVFNNAYRKTGGWIKTSCAFAVKTSDGDKHLAHKTLGEALGLSLEQNKWAIFQDQHSGLEFLRPSREILENGLFVELKEYGTQVFWNWREAGDEGGLYARLHEQLSGAGVPSVDLALRELLLEPIHAPFKTLCDAKVWRAAFEGESAELEKRAEKFAVALGKFLKVEVDAKNFAAELIAALVENEPQDVGNEPVVVDGQQTDVGNEPGVVGSERTNVETEPGVVGGEAADAATLLAYTLLKLIGEVSGQKNGREKARLWLDEWLLGGPLQSVLRELGASDGALFEIKLCLSYAGEAPKNAFDLLAKLLADGEVQQFLGINNFERTIWFRGEKVGELLEILEIGGALEGVELPLEALQRTADAAEFRVVKWMELTRQAT